MTDRGLFFVHIMKTGGGSLGRSLRSQFDSDRTYPNPKLGAVGEKLQIPKILSLSAERRASIDLYSVHMPAWIADRVAPQYLTLTVLREPVSRTISHLRHIARSQHAPDDLTEIYDDPKWNRRITNYQTRMLSMTEDDFRERAAVVEQHRELLGRSHRDQGELLASMDPFLRTGVVVQGDLSADAIRIALDRVDSIDVLGVTEDLDGLVRRLSRRIGREFPRPQHLNPASNQLPVSQDLRDRVERESESDRQLYESARARLARE